MLLTEFSDVMLSKNTAFGSGSLPSSSSELLVLDESLVSSSWSYKWIPWPWYCGLCTISCTCSRRFFMHTFCKCPVFLQYEHLACVAGHVASLLCLFPHLKQPVSLNFNLGLLVDGLRCLNSLFERLCYDCLLVLSLQMKLPSFCFLWSTIQCFAPLA